ncbi:MAG: 4Fe-4S binding protein [Spirochaetia bacterium]|nr:4Fe-4S binding protein [Spirochaetia bacterium]
MAGKLSYVNIDRCAACGACENECPSGAIKVYRGCFAAVSPEKCIGCGKCAKICPACIIEIRETDVK